MRVIRTGVRATRDTTKAVAFGIEVVVAIVAPFIACLWRDRPGEYGVKHYAFTRNPLARWPQNVGAFLWVALAVPHGRDLIRPLHIHLPGLLVWLLGAAIGFGAWLASLIPGIHIIAIPVSVFVLMRRIRVGLTKRGWPLRQMLVSTRVWLHEDWFLLAPAAMALAIWAWVSNYPHPWGCVILGLLGIATWISLREVREDMRLRRQWAFIEGPLGLSDARDRDVMHSLPNGWRHYGWNVNLVGDARYRLGDLEAKVAEERPHQEIQDFYSALTGEHRVSFVKASPATKAARELAAIFGGLVVDLRPTGNSTAERPDEHVAIYNSKITEIGEIDAIAFERFGLSVVGWDRDTHRVFLARLLPEVRRQRQRLYPHIPGAKFPWDIDLSLEFDEAGQVEALNLPRFPAITDPAKRRDEYLKTVATVWPIVDEGRSYWAFEDKPADDALRCERRKDPLADGQVWSIDDFSVDLSFDAIPVGMQLNGLPAFWRVSERPGLVVGGLPGGGKSAALATLFAGLAMSPCVQFIIFDGKGGQDWTWMRERAVIINRDYSNLEEVANRLQKIHDLMVWRNAHIETLRPGSPNIWHEGPSRDMPLLVTLFDECQSFFATKGLSGERKALVERIQRLVEALIKIGRSTGFLTVSATQKPTEDSIPTAIRDNCEGRAAFKMKSDAAEVATLGERGLPTPQNMPAQPGRAVVEMDSGDRGIMRFAFTPHDVLVEIARRSAHYRDDTIFDVLEGAAPAPTRVAEPEPEYETGEIIIPVHETEMNLNLDDLFPGASEEAMGAGAGSSAPELESAAASPSAAGDESSVLVGGEPAAGDDGRDWGSGW